MGQTLADDEAYRDDKEIWDKESYEFYVNLFEEWAKGYNWYEQVNLEIDTGYKNSAVFLDNPKTPYPTQTQKYGLD